MNGHLMANVEVQWAAKPIHWNARLGLQGLKHAWQTAAAQSAQAPARGKTYLKEQPPRSKKMAKRTVTAAQKIAESRVAASKKIAGSTSRACASGTLDVNFGIVNLQT